MADKGSSSRNSAIRYSIAKLMDKIYSAKYLVFKSKGRHLKNVGYRKDPESEKRAFPRSLSL